MAIKFVGFVYSQHFNSGTVYGAGVKKLEGEDVDREIWQWQAGTGAEIVLVSENEAEAKEAGFQAACAYWQQFL